jgi:hypothetical protein
VTAGGERRLGGTGEVARSWESQGEGKGGACEGPHHRAEPQGRLIDGRQQRSGGAAAGRSGDGGGALRARVLSARRRLQLRFRGAGVLAALK